MKRPANKSSGVPHQAVVPFLCILLAANHGCDDPDAIPPDESTQDDAADDAALDRTNPLDPSARPDPSAVASVDAELPASELPHAPWHDDDDLTQPLHPQAAGNFPTFEVSPPFRADDLKPKHYITMNLDTDRWHDQSVSRRNDGWFSNQPGLAGETNSVAWDTPVYAGVDGEVMACWRDAPYIEAQVDAPGVPHSGNFVIIKTDDGRWIYYAHMQTDSIPTTVCPIYDVDGLINNTNAHICAPATANSKECPLTETYITPSLRPRVHAGQAIGKVGAHGNARGAHLHMGAGNIGTSAQGYDQTLQTGYHIVFDSAWNVPVTGNVPPFAWSHSTGMDIPNAVDDDDLLVWPGWKHEATYAASYRMADYSGNGADDLLCHNVLTGQLRIDYAASGLLDGTNWTRTGGWCSSASQRLHNGDFNGDGKDDLLCHDIETGGLWVDYADANSQFVVTDFEAAHFWCNGDSQQLRIGDFDGDGKDDLLCHNHATGAMHIDRSTGTTTPFAGTDTMPPNPWCPGHYQRLHVGKFDANTSDDLLCHDTRSGARFVDLAGSVASALFTGTNSTPSAWCNGLGQRLFVADVDGLGGDDLVCHDSDDGTIHVDSGTLGATNWTGAAAGWCTAPYQRIKIGDINGDGKDDLVCHDQVSGKRWVDYSNDGEFTGTNWSSPAGNVWCEGAREALH